MEPSFENRISVRSVVEHRGQSVLLRGWVFRLRQLASTTFVVLRDSSGEVQCVCHPREVAELHLKLDDAIEIVGSVRDEPRAKLGVEVDIERVRVLNPATHKLPFNTSSDLSGVGPDARLEYRPLAARNQAIGDVFRVQGALLRYFRAFLLEHGFTEIITSKIVASGTEGGTNLFTIDYFERTAYLAQSPQFYKEHGVAAFERVFETGHVYRAEPHASARHLTEYYSLDLEFGFIDAAEDVIRLEKELLTSMFARLNESHGDMLKRLGAEPPPSMLHAPIWEFGECLDRLRSAHGTKHLTDDLDPEAERRLCVLAEKATGVPAVFVVGFPLSGRPFYSAPRGSNGAAQSFDLLFRGVEITTGGQRLHRRADLEAALRGRGIDPTDFESHLKMFELGMPPHGGLAIGLERLTAQVLGLNNVRDAVLYPRDRDRLTP
ncbi:MAG TPA: aspartate--tRNA(Asn) ligase [Pseudomonadales bacterium]|nr:aspartate--tRNA(Asn) ligase [Pseudomonadales bacterium]